MTTGDPTNTCPYCNVTYYIVNGHNCTHSVYNRFGNNYYQVGDMLEYNLDNMFYIIGEYDITFPNKAYPAKIYAEGKLKELNDNTMKVVTYDEAIQILDKNNYILYGLNP